MKREEAESDLVFCGFIISECPLKEDSKAVIGELVKSAHEVKMITGDNVLTAAFVAQELNFAPKSQRRSLFISSVTPANRQIKWSDLDENFVSKTSSAQEVATLSKQYLLCVNGDMLEKVFEIERVG